MHLKVIQLHNPDKYRDEKELIRRAIKQDREAQHLLFEWHAPKMLSVCRYYIKDVQQAEEAMLNGFFKVFRYLRKFRSEGSFEGWIRRIMIRESISLLRSKKNIEFPTDDISIHERGTAYTNTELEVEDIQRLIDGLPDGYRMVFIMYAIEGYKHSEIAQLLKISESTSKSQLFKARKVLQQKVNKLNKTSNGTNQI